MKEESVIISGRIDQGYNWSAGIAGSRFLRELKENARIMGTKCTKCNRILVPPRIFCEECFSKVDTWEVVQETGIIETFAVSYYSATMELLETPQIIAVIKFDGTDAGMVHFLGETDDPKKIKIGQKVRAVFKDKEERTGSILDIKYFKLI